MTETGFAPFCSTEITFASPEEMQKKVLLSCAGKDVVLLMSKNGELRWGLSSFSAEIEGSANSFARISEIPANPSVESICKALNSISPRPVNLIVAVGGGSCIDLAKCISALYLPNVVQSEDSVLKAILEKSYTSCKGTDIVAIPTTSGTGSEVTQWATVWDPKNKEKYSVDCPQLKPKAAIIVPELTATLSKELTVSTGLDALCHATEAYWSRFTTPLVRDIAYRAVELILKNLKNASENPSDIRLRETMCRASLLAGIAFSQTRTTACHAISYPLTILYNINHGFAVALTLSSLAEFNRGYFPNDEELFELFSRYDGIKNWVNDVCEGVAVLDAKALGVTDFYEVAKAACNSGRMKNNPRDVGEEDVVRFLMQDSCTNQ